VGGVYQELPYGEKERGKSISILYYLFSMKAINPLGFLLSLPLPLPLHPRLVSETAHDFGRQIVNEVVVLVDGILQSLLARLLEVV
jgi:hypothetical protein